MVDMLFWVALRRYFSNWKRALIVVAPENSRWDRAGFRMYWKVILKCDSWSFEWLLRTRAG